jgi:hypothetical protein
MANLINHQGNAMKGSLDRVRSDQFIFPPLYPIQPILFCSAGLRGYALAGHAVTTGDGNA